MPAIRKTLIIAVLAVAVSIAVILPTAVSVSFARWESANVKAGGSFDVVVTKKNDGDFSHENDFSAVTSDGKEIVLNEDVIEYKGETYRLGTYTGFLDVTPPEEITVQIFFEGKPVSYDYNDKSGKGVSVTHEKGSTLYTVKVDSGKRLKIYLTKGDLEFSVVS